MFKVSHSYQLGELIVFQPLFDCLHVLFSYESYSKQKKYRTFLLSLYSVLWLCFGSLVQIKITVCNAWISQSWALALSLLRNSKEIFLPALSLFKPCFIYWRKQWCLYTWSTQSFITHSRYTTNSLVRMGSEIIQNHPLAEMCRGKILITI